MNDTPKNRLIRRADRLFDEANLPQETQVIRQEIRAFAEEYLAPIAHEINTTPEDPQNFPRELMRKMGEAGFYRIPYSKAEGGRGLTYPILAVQVLEEELAYFSNGVAATLYDAPIALAGACLNRFASQSIKNRYMPGIMSGELLGSFATSEPLASTDLAADKITTSAVRVDGGFEVNGVKRWITNAIVADYAVFLCNLNGNLIMLLTDMDVDGVSVTRPDRKLGNHVQLTSEIHFKSVFVPEENLIGSENGGLRVALSALTEGRLAVASMGIGMAQAAFDHAVDYMQSRELFGTTLGQMQYWRFKFAEHAIGIENARNLVAKAARHIDETGDTNTPLGPMAKVYATKLSREVANDALQVCGAMGFVRDLGGTGEQRPLETIYRDCKIGEIYEGANEVMLDVISRSIFGGNRA